MHQTFDLERPNFWW